MIPRPVQYDTEYVRRYIEKAVCLQIRNLMQSTVRFLRCFGTVTKDNNSRVLVGGWASIYIEMPLRAMDLKSLLLLLMSTKLVTPLRAMELLALMFTGNTTNYYQDLCIFLRT